MKFAPALILAIALTACQPSSSEPKITAIVGAKLIDGKGSAPIDHSIVLIQGTTIVKVGPQSQVPLPKDAEVVDGLGQTLEPASGGTTIDAGSPATLTLKNTTKTRTMKDGQWQN